MNLTIFLYLLSQIVFLLPIKDRRGPKRSFPWATATLIVVNTLIHLWITVLALQQSDSFEETVWYMLYPFMEVPRLILDGEGLGALSILTSGFLHAGWGHLLGNMFILWFFGRKVEDATGSVRFVLLYLLCIYTSALLSVVVRGSISPAQAAVPGLGASGAIFGIMTAYLFLYSDQRILTLIIPIPWLFWIPAWIYIVHQLIGNALLGELIQENVVFVSVNVFAHLGGAAGGLLFIYFFLHPEVFAQRR